MKESEIFQLNGLIGMVDTSGMINNEKPDLCSSPTTRVSPNAFAIWAATVSRLFARRT